MTTGFGRYSRPSTPRPATLRRALIGDRVDRDAIASQLLRYRDGPGDAWADIVDMLTMHPEERRKVARVLGEIEAGDGGLAEL